MLSIKATCYLLGHFHTATIISKNAARRIYRARPKSLKTTFASIASGGIFSDFASATASRLSAAGSLTTSSPSAIGRLSSRTIVTT